MKLSINDPSFRVEVISQTPNPQQVTYAAMHQDYSDTFVSEDRDKWPNEQNCGILIKKNLLNSNRGHYGPLEHPQLALNCGYFPHSAMQQLRTHRNVSFDVQSFRYTGDAIADFGKSVFEHAGWENPKHIEHYQSQAEKLFYLRPTGPYTNRQGKRYTYTEDLRKSHLAVCIESAVRYYLDTIESGLSEEHARGVIPFDIRQHWVVSGNARAIMHLLDVRGKMDVQLEARTCIEMIFEHFKEWMPEVASWYEENRWRKGRLAP